MDLIFNLLLIIQLLCVTSAASASQVLPGCQEKCGNVTIPYPFGMERGCYKAEDGWFQVTCNSSYIPPKPFIGTSKMEIIEFSQGEVLIKNWIAYSCYSEMGRLVNQSPTWIDLEGTPYR